MDFVDFGKKIQKLFERFWFPMVASLMAQEEACYGSRFWHFVPGLWFRLRFAIGGFID